MLEKAGFSPFSSGSPLNSSLNQVFNRFIKKTGLDTTTEKLKEQFFTNNANTRKALDVYQSLENTFSYKGEGEQPAIVDFLNNKIEGFVAEQDTNEDDTLTLKESEITESLFDEIDTNRDSRINTDEIKSNFYSDFQQLNNVMDYFRSTPGVLVDIFG